jgi:nucleoside-diphosphate-sugar epimerase
MAQERWLVTGASGQLGGHVLARLGEQRPSAQILALVGRGRVAASGADVQRVDLSDLGALRDCAASFRPTHVLHLAAITSVAQAYERLVPGGHRAV